MKQIGIILLFIALPTIGLFAQWNENGDNKTTGNLTVEKGLSSSSSVFSTNLYGIRIATDVNRSPQLKITSSLDSIFFRLNRDNGNLQLLRYLNGSARTHLCFTRDLKVGILNNTPTTALDVGGTIKAKELKVDGTIYAKSVKVRVDGGADYVFDADYKLRDLSEVEAFVRENKHLPEIQSEKDMQANGIDMNEFQIKLLQKIEELTLYTIQQNNQIKEQNIQMIEQNKRIEQLEQKLNSKN